MADCGEIGSLLVPAAACSSSSEFASPSSEPASSSAPFAAEIDIGEIEARTRLRLRCGGTVAEPLIGEPETEQKEKDAVGDQDGERVANPHPGEADVQQDERDEEP